MKIENIRFSPQEEDIHVYGEFGGEKYTAVFGRGKFGELSEEDRYKKCEEEIILQNDLNAIV